MGTLQTFCAIRDQNKHMHTSVYTQFLINIKSEQQSVQFHTDSTVAQHRIQLICIFTTSKEVKASVTLAHLIKFKILLCKSKRIVQLLFELLNKNIAFTQTLNYQYYQFDHELYINNEQLLSMKLKTIVSCHF